MHHKAPQKRPQSCQQNQPKRAKTISKTRSQQSDPKGPPGAPGRPLKVPLGPKKRPTNALKLIRLPIADPSIISSHSTYNVWYSGTSLWQVPLQKTSSASFVALLPFFFAPEQILHSRRLSDRVIQSCTMSASKSFLGKLAIADPSIIRSHSRGDVLQGFPAQC